jgi:riboflavin synthase
VFTGIVEALGEVRLLEARGEDACLHISTDLAAELAIGESIAVNGVCLTVASRESEVFAADVMPESLRRSTLSSLRGGQHVNLERAVTPASRLGGHVVQGHVDGVGILVSRDPGPRWDEVRIRVPAELSRYVAVKGSVAVDGVSLTVMDVHDDEFMVGLIPTTLRLTTLGETEPGDEVNIETDVMAKYVERLLDARAGLRVGVSS